MDVFLTIRREKVTLFIDTKENTTVYQLKQLIQGITKKKPEDQRLVKIGTNAVLDDKKTLAECGYDSQQCKPQEPGVMGLVFRVDEGEEFEEVNIEPYSSPPDLPDVMKDHPEIQEPM